MIKDAIKEELLKLIAGEEHYLMQRIMLDDKPNYDQLAEDNFLTKLK